MHSFHSFVKYSLFPADEKIKIFIAFLAYELSNHIDAFQVLLEYFRKLQISALVYVAHLPCD